MGFLQGGYCGELAASYIGWLVHLERGNDTIGIGDAMIFLLKYWKPIAIIAAAVGIFFAGYFKGGDAVQRRWDADTARLVAEQLAASQANQTAIAKLQETKNANLKTISDLRRYLTSFRVRLPTACSTATTGGGEIPIETGGVLHGSVEIVLGADRQRTAGIVEAAEVELNDCRVVKNWAANQIQRIGN